MLSHWQRCLDCRAHSRIVSLLIRVYASGADEGQGHLFRKRSDAVVTYTVWETVQAPDIIVVVDENGNFISQSVAEPTPGPIAAAEPQIPAEAPAAMVTYAPNPADIAPPSSEPETHDVIAQEPTQESAQPGEQPAPEQHPAPVSYEPPAEEPAPVAPVEPVTPPPPAPEVNQVASANGYEFNQRSGYGIGWSNYNGDQFSTSCKDFDQADQEWAQLTDYDVVRIYGADCGQPGISFKLAKKYGKKVFVGLYWLDERFDDQIQAIVDAVADSGIGWDAVDTVSIGNEDVHRREKTPGEIIAYVQRAKGRLSEAGYNGPVVHVDSQDSILANPELCSEDAGDYIAANVHPFFNDHTPADQAGQFVRDQLELLRSCGASKRRRRSDVRVRVAEVGWPKNGDPNGEAVPGKANQRVALESIKNAAADHLIFFSAFDHKWMKDGPTTFNTEQHWGILDG